jgi:molybdopterin-synthase adenylyltransferase
MANKWHHEKILRGNEAMKKLASAKVLICGAGAIGSNLAVNLARMGITKLTVVDKDRVEEHNIGTQVYGIDDIGAKKSECLRNLIFREVGEEIVSVPQELTERNAGKLLHGFDLAVDAFDNSASRKILFDVSNQSKSVCLHVGLSGEYGHVHWNESYIVPGGANDDVCDYPLARNLIMIVMAITSESIVRYLLNGEMKNLSFTLDDLSINREDA